MDVYKDWLGIPNGPRPPDHYELLRCRRFEDDIEKIRAHQKKLGAHVKKYATGQYMLQSQQLLNEMARAMICLTDPDRKREYDEGLGREFEAKRDEFGRQPLLDVLVAQGKISKDQKREVEQFSTARGLTERDAVVQMKLVGPEAAAQALAIQLGFSHVDLDDMLPEDDVLDSVPRALVKKHTFLPLFIDDGRLLIACIDQPEHELEEELRLRFDAPVRPVIATPRAVNQAIAKYYAAGARDESKAAATVSAKGKAARTSAPAKSKGPRRNWDQLTPEEQQQKKQIGYIAMCWTVILCMAPQILWGIGLLTAPLFGMDIWSCIGLAILVGGGMAWWVTQRYWK
jgi:hypothetical protein